ncbi:MAG: hemerythrin domain-containing protein [Ideonella sp.]|nr:hemerythrin domain-containing protein [Ideonella sp.]
MSDALLALQPSPAAGFDQPLDMLDGCHERLRRSLALLERLSAHLAVHGADQPAREAARDVLRYFDLAAPHHHHDEELHLVPLLQRNADTQAWAQQLLSDHAYLAQAWSAARPALAEVCRGVWPPLAGASAIQAHWAHWAQRLRAHAAWEDAVVYPWVRIHLDASQAQAMGQEMAERRGVR